VNHCDPERAHPVTHPRSADNQFAKRLHCSRPFQDNSSITNSEFTRGQVLILKPRSNQRSVNYLLVVKNADLETVSPESGALSGHFVQLQPSETSPGLISLFGRPGRNTAAMKARRSSGYESTRNRTIAIERTGHCHNDSRPSSDRGPRGGGGRR
jgi:hypothetical protein